MNNYNLNADQRLSFHSCPRCGEHGFEKLRTHNHCVGCNYFEIIETHSYENQSLMCDEIIKDFNSNSRTKSYKTLEAKKSQELKHLLNPGSKIYAA